MWDMCAQKLDMLNKGGLSKDNFKDAESHTVANAANLKVSKNKSITDYFSQTFTEEEMQKFVEEDWDEEIEPANVAKKPKLEM